MNLSPLPGSLLLLRDLALGLEPRHQEFARFVGAGGLDLLGPGVEVGLRDDMDLDRHVGMVLAAEFRALAVIDAFPGGLEPVLVEAAGYGVDLHAEGRNGPGMDDAFGIRGHM